MRAGRETLWRLHGYVGQVTCVRERTADGWTVSLFYRSDPEPSWTQTVEDLDAGLDNAEHFRQALLVQGFFDCDPC